MPNCVRKEELQKMYMKAQGFSELSVAASQGDLRTVRAIIKARTHEDLNCPETWMKMTPLHAAINSKNIQVIDELIRAGADVNSNAGMMRPVFTGIITGNVEVVRFLLDNGANFFTLEIEESSLLHAAADAGHAEIAKLLIERGMEVDIPNKRNETPLHTAANIGQTEVARLLVAKGADVFATCSIVKDTIYDNKTKMGLEKNVTPLFLAALRGHLDIVNILLSAGADVNAKSRKNYTALHMATQIGHVELVKRLLEAGAESSINVRAGDSDYTPLTLAAKTGKVDLVKVLLRVDSVNINPIVAMKETPLGAAICTGHLAVIKLLLANGVPINSRAADKSTPLHVAVQEEKYDIAEFLIAHGADINAMEKNNVTPLYVACGKGILKLVKSLVRKGAFVDARTNIGTTPMMIAATSNHLETVKFLVDRGVNYNAADNDNRTVLDYATDSGHVKIVAYLVAKILENDAKSPLLKMPLHIAVHKGHTEVVEILCATDINVNGEENAKCNLLHTALTCGHLEIAELLLKRNVHVNFKDSDGITPLFLAVKKKHLKLVNSLLDRGADVNAANEFGVLPIHVAVKAENVDIVKALLAKGACYDKEARTKKYLGVPLKFARKVSNAKLVTILELIKKLFSSVIKNDMYQIELCVQAGAILNARNVSGRTALHYAVSNLNIDAVKTLVTGGADVTLATEKGNLPLHLAVLNECIEITEIIVGHAKNLSFIKYNSVVNAKTIVSGSIALHTAAEKSNLHIVKLLLASGAVYNAKNNSGKMPLELTTLEEIKSLLISAEKLFEAVKKKDAMEEVVSILKNDNSTTNAREAGNGGTPLYWSVSKGHNNIANILLSHGADYRLVTNKGTTPLHIAASKGNVKIVNMLLNRVRNEGADKAADFINATTVSGTAALHVASNLEVVKCLLQASATYDICNGEDKTALALTQNDDVRRLLQTVHQVFEDVKKGVSTVMDTINSLDIDELKAVMNTRNTQGRTLVQVARGSGYFRMADKLLKKLKSN